jgi:hypothetical protein
LRVSLPCFLEAAREAAVSPDRLPNTIRSSNRIAHQAVTAMEAA